ncbi:UDP-glucose 4-epimerase GalE [Desulfovibrio sp. OttesenSCG-928-F20]|nr:UDP-glucose 4-epimerase GalE [Desulfovibrio sp. OttesenSCG-928-F20]
MKILVTGGAGYVGSHTCKALAEAGHDVVVYDNLSTGHRDLIRWGDFFHGDIGDYSALVACMKRYKPEGVIHFAAWSQVGESVSDPGKYFKNNVAGTLNLLCAMRDQGLEAIVVSGTCAVYGEPKEQPITEKCPTNPINPYGASKLFMERMLADFEIAHGLRWMSLRYFNAAGADIAAETGERHMPESHLIPRMFMAMDGSAPPLQVFGDSYPTPDGTCIRDYVHVADLATAHVTAIEHGLSGGQSAAVNLGTGKGLSVFEIIKAARDSLGKDAPYVVAAKRVGDPPILTADYSLARTLLGWQPLCSDADSILSSAWRWHEKDRPARNRLQQASHANRR